MKKQMLTAGAGVLLSLTLFQGAASAESYKVQPGDTLWGISHSYKTTVPALKNANNLSTDRIYIGQSLQIPEKSQAKTTTIQQTTSSSENDTYIVKRGDTLSKIGAKFGVSYPVIMKLNNLRSTTIFPGQKIVLSSTKVAKAELPEQPAPAPAPEPVKPETETDSTESQQTYTVKSGDTLWGISKMFGVSVSEIKSWNGLSSDVIRTGQTLQISGASSAAVPTVQPKQTAAPASSGVINESKLVSDAKALVGVPYKWAGNTPSGFDCSGFIAYVINKQYSIPRMSTASYWSRMQNVSSPAVGDFVYFQTYKAGPSHMGIYVGGGNFIHASSSKGVTVSSLSNSYWKPRYLGAKRLVN